MIFSDFMARQLSKPEGWFGKFVMGRLLDRVNRQGNQLVYDRLNPKSSERAIEIGFGGGKLMFRVAAALHDGSIDGVEVSLPMLEQARTRALKLNLTARMNFYSASVESLPCASETYDCAYSVNTVYFWPDIKTGVAEISRVLKPGGRLVLGFGSDRALRQAGYEEKGFKLYSSEQIVTACAANGFLHGECANIDGESRGSFYAYRGFKPE